MKTKCQTEFAQRQLRPTECSHIRRLAAIVGAVIGLLAASAVVADGAETVHYLYDTMQRLTRVTQPDGITIDYVYDALGNRLMKTTTLPGAPSNQPPAAVTNPSIANGATNVPTTAPLSWSPAVDPDSGDSVVYFIYFGTSVPPPLAFSGWTTNWSPGKLHGLTTYYWQIVARDSHNAQTASPVWSFTTGNEPPVADFAVTPTNGSAPLAVTFTDRSFDTDNAIVSWQWDFDNNGTVDSTNRNPTFTYTTPGDYTVRLTVRDEAGAATTMVKTNLISILGNNIVDLAPLGLTIESATSYRHLVVRYAITNQGAISLSGKWQWADTFYVSTNAFLDASATQIATFYENQTLPAAAVYARTNMVTIPDIAAENYYLILKSDGQDQIGEISEGNNVWVVPMTNNLPDLVAANLQAFGETIAGQHIQVTYAVTNQGRLRIDAEWDDGIYLSTNATWDAQDARLGDVHIPLALNSGDGYLATNSITLPNWPPGAYHLILRADANNWIVESNEFNNAATIPITLTAPDLSPVSLVAAQSNVVFYPTSPQSPPLSVVWGVTNQGTGAASGGWYDEAYVSTNAVLDGSAVQVGYEWEDWGSPALAAGGTYWRTNTLNLPRQSGTYYLFFKADSRNWLYEGNESNNVAMIGPVTVTYEVRPPDLALTGFDVPSVAASQQSVPVVWTVGNRGLGAAQPYWYDGIYFSTDETWDRFDTALLTVGHNMVLTNGGSYAVTNAITWPAIPIGGVEVIPGTCLSPMDAPDAEGTILREYWLGIGGNTVSNLTGSSRYQESPDGVDVLRRFEGPENWGDNYGSRIRGYVHPPVSGAYTFWIASDDESELWLSSDQNPGNKVRVAWVPGWTNAREWGKYAEQKSQPVTLNAGSKYYIEALHKEEWGGDNVAVGWQTPAYERQYYLIARANADGQLFETSRTNNEIVVPIQILMPDLAPAAVALQETNVVFYPTRPQSPTVQIVYAVTNMGTGMTAGGWVDRAYVSTNAMLDGQDGVALSEYEDGPVAPGGFYWRTNTVSLPQQSGAYWVFFKTDGGDWLYEGNESNNVAMIGPVTVTYEVRPPDLSPVRLVPATNSVVFYPTSPQSPTVAVNWAVTNAGNGVAAGQWYDQIYVSTNTTLSGQVGAAFTGWQYGPVPVSGAYSGNTTVTLPQQSGTYYLIFSADDNNRLYEGSDANNLLVSAPLTLVYEVRAPDLVASNLTWSGQPVAGQVLTVVWTVANLGSTTAQPTWYDAVYFSTNAVLDGPDTQLRSQSRSLALAVGGSYQVTNTVAIPANAPPSYYLILNTDNQNAVFETNEANNVLAVPIVVIGQDLAPVLTGGQFLTDGCFQLAVYGLIGTNYTLQASTNLVNWVSIFNFTCTNSPTYVVDPGAKYFGWRFYRVAQGTLPVMLKLALNSPVPLATNGLGFNVQAPLGFSYVIQASTDLVNWQPFTNFIGTNSIMFFRDQDSANYSRRFYRAVMP